MRLSKAKRHKRSDFVFRQRNFVMRLLSLEFGIPILFFMAIIPSQALGAIFLKPSATYSQAGELIGVNETKSTRSVVDVSGGLYDDSIGFTLHGTYASDKSSTHSEPPVIDTNQSRTSTGLGIGYIQSRDPGFFVLGHYYFNSEYATATTSYKGKGYQVDVGCKLAFYKVSLGFQLSYRKYKFDKDRDQKDIADPIEQAFIDPMFTLIVPF